MPTDVSIEAQKQLFYVRTTNNIYCIKKQRNIDKKNESDDQFKSTDRMPLSKMKSSGAPKEGTSTGKSLGGGDSVELEQSIKDTENSSLTSLISN